MTDQHSPPPGILPAGVNRGSAMAALAALLDRSVEQIAEAAADARRYDREAIRAASDVWDNNLFPLFWAASTASAGKRERRALTALEWMAGLGERRRRWMIEQAAIAGYELEPLLPPAEPYRPGRDYLGHVMPPVYRLTRQTVDELALDYDLATAAVRHLRAERAGTRLTAFLQLAVPRRYAAGEDTPAQPALLNVTLEGVTDTVFDHSDTRGADLDPGADGIGISLGTGGRLRAARGACHPDDSSWHLSAAGRRADAVTPPRTDRSDRRPPGGDLGADARAAAVLLRYAMWELRSVRYAARADRVPVLDLCRAFSGAGGAILAAGARRGARRREAAFRDVIQTWAARGGPELTRWFATVLREHAGRPDIIEAPESPGRTPPSRTDSPPVPGAPEQAALVMAAWTATHTGYRTHHPAAAQLHLALPPRPDEPPSARWRLRTVSCTEPDVFRLHTDAFHGPGPLTRTGRPTAARSLDLHRGALLVTARDGWSASAN
ncbi:hypothetical protein GCM10010420_54890 [Streptomyces glaucosporus]|uniref:Uncharacterized protein n=1 Tax=Streptomyces glaucosporus TaxID=284044 RepID=A0ABN3J0B9_9ACTN